MVERTITGIIELWSKIDVGETKGKPWFKMECRIKGLDEMFVFFPDTAEHGAKMIKNSPEGSEVEFIQWQKEGSEKWNYKKKTFKVLNLNDDKQETPAKLDIPEEDVQDYSGGCDFIKNNSDLKLKFTKITDLKPRLAKTKHEGINEIKISTPIASRSILLFEKISLVMKDIDYLEKDGQIKFGTTNYKAISEEKVTMSVRKSLIKHGLIILPVSQRHNKKDNLTTVDVDYKIIDIETGQYEIIVSSGTGIDTQDKGVGKAMTYAYKYMLLRTFAIPTGEDPDKISSAELDAKTK